MTFAATLALFAAALTLYVAALARRFSLAPGWRDQRWFSLGALAIAACSALDVPSALEAWPSLVVWAASTKMLLAGIHQYAWLRYSDTHLGVRPGPVLRALERLPIAAGAAALIPGFAYGGATRGHTFAPVGMSFVDAVPTAAGLLVLAIQNAVFVVLVARYARAAGRGVPHALLHLGALAFLLALGTNDVLAAAGLLAMPYLVNFGFVVPVAAVGYSLTARFTADARSLAELRLRLESLVDERTRELASAQEALHRSEKLAALGQFAAGVAHEVNNPAAVVTANLSYLAECKDEEGAWPSDTGDCVRESLGSMERIARIVRQLLDAGRLSAGSVATAAVALAPIAQESLRAARARCGGARVRLIDEVAPEVVALGQEAVLVQVLENLVVNAVQAIPAGRRDGCVTVRAERGGGRVRVLVEDNGAGMKPEVLRRVFEPFFSTKPFGIGTGLGLAVSRGLVQSLGGDLRLESMPSGGIRATVELPETSDPVHADAGERAPAGLAHRSGTGAPR